MITAKFNSMKNYLLAIVACLSISLYGQDVHTGYHSNSFLLQSTVNPAAFPEGDMVISLPVLANTSYSIKWPFSLNDILEKGADDSLRISLPHLSSNLSEDNIFSAEMHRNLFFAGLKVGKKKNIFAYVGDDIVSSFGINLSDEFVNYIVKGNASFLNEQQSFDQERIDVMVYNKFYMGASMKLDEKWNVGARLNFLTGILNVHTERMNLGFYTDSTSAPIYETTLSADMLIQTSGLGLMTDTLEFNPISNSGFSLDLGASYKYNEDWLFSLALKDIGSINWAQENNKLYTTDAKSTYVIEGLTQSSAGAEDLGVQMEEITDSLRASLEPTSVEKSYATNLNASIYLGAQYQLSEKHQFSALLHTRKKYDRPFTVFNLGYQYQLAKSLELLASYRNYNGINNIGAGMVWNPGIVQLHFILDNLMVADVFDAQNFAYQFGLSFHFGKDGKKK